MIPILVINFSRSGGTLLARILGSDKRVVLASEINPTVGVNHEHKPTRPEIALRDQMSAWYGISLSSASFEDCLDELIAHCEDRGLQLILRDWTCHDFVPSPWNGWQPAARLKMVDRLARIGEFRTFALIRDAIDVYLSGGVPLEIFSPAYLRYVEEIRRAGIPIMKYEDLVKNPRLFLESLQSYISLPVEAGIFKYHTNYKVTGDVQFGYRSRGVRSGAIRRLPRKWIPASRRREIDACAQMARANEIFGYPSRYAHGNVESFFQMLKRRLLNTFLRLIPFPKIVKWNVE